MKFSEFTYERPNFEEYQKEMRSSIEKFVAAESAEEQITYLDQINVLRNKISTQSTLSSIRHSINNNDEFYNAENDYWDEYGPLYQNEESALAKTILSSKFIDELKAHYTRGGLGDVKVKRFLNSILQEELEPIRQRRKEFEKDIPEVYRILKEGSEVARKIAAQTLSEVKSAMGINYFEDTDLINSQVKKFQA